MPRTDFAGRSTLEFFVRARGGIPSDVIRDFEGRWRATDFCWAIRSPENWDFQMLTGMRHMEKTALKQRGQGRLLNRVQQWSSICSQCLGAMKNEVGRYHW